MARPKALISWSSGKDSAFALHEVTARGRVRGGRRADDGDRNFRPGIDPRRAAGDPAGAMRGRRPAAADRADPLSLPERDLRGADGRGGRAGRCRRHHPHDLRRSLSRRYPRLSRAETGRHRHHAGVSAVGAADAGTGAGDDRERAGSVYRNRRSEEAAGGIRRPQIRCAACWPICPRRRSLRRERRVSHLRGGRADVFAAACGHTGERVERDGYAYCDLVRASRGAVGWAHAPSTDLLQRSTPSSAGKPKSTAAAISA